MAMPASRRLVKFGVFELDLRTGELRKNGLKVRLAEQPLQALVALVENSGELVTREQLRERLWPGGTFVDFEHSLNAAVKKLRDALGDTAENPRFIETLARRGYRFLAPVEWIRRQARAMAQVAARCGCGRACAGRWLCHLAAASASRSGKHQHT